MSSRYGNKPMPASGTPCECGDHYFASVGHGSVTLVSPQDAHLLDRKWRVCIKGRKRYHQVARSQHNAVPHTVILARLVTGAGPDEQVDHANSDSLDNRRPNLRVCSPLQNAHNRRAVRGAKVPFKGVIVTPYGTYRASIMAAGKRRYLGTFKTASEAHAAYSAAADLLHGEYARAA